MSFVVDKEFYKILSLGDSGVGKSTFLLRYTDNVFESQLPTIGIDFKIKKCNINNQEITLKIWDTAGQDRFRNLSRQYYKNADGVLLMFDLTNYGSFKQINFWLKELSNHISIKKVPILLIGTKSDLESKRKVKQEEINKLSTFYKINYYESSSYSNKNIKEVFEDMANKIYRIKMKIMKDDEDSIIFKLNDSSSDIPIRNKIPKLDDSKCNSNCCGN